MKHSSLQALTYRYYTGMNDLHQNDSVTAEYIWIDGTDINLRSKARTLRTKPEKLEDLPDWNYDGSSTYQASTHNSEVILKPVAMFNDPFRAGENVLVICETYVWADEHYKTLKPANTNFRHYAKKIFDAGAHEEPWFGIEQEYAVLEEKNNFSTRPLGWPQNGFPGPQGAFYCSVGANIAYGRAILDAHYKACLYSGIKISGVNMETMPGQLEF
jgi:glutamine synthetase